MLLQTAKKKIIKLKSGFKPVHYNSRCIEAYNQGLVSPNLKACNNPPSCNDSMKKNY